MQVLNDYKQKWFDFLGYEPHEGQRKLHFPTKESARFFVMVCGRRFGRRLRVLWKRPFTPPSRIKEYGL